jgi:type IV pilus assembly protein PilA
MRTASRGVVTLAVLALSSLAWSALAQQPPHAEAGPLPREALVLPAESGMLLGVDARSLFASAEYKALLGGTLPGGMPLSAQDQAKLRDGVAKGLADLEQKTGVRLDRDVDRLVLSLGSFDAKQPVIAGLVMGRFDPARVGAAFEASADKGSSVAKKTVRGRTLFVMSRGGSPTLALTFLEPGLLLFGTPAAVEATLTGHVQGQRPLASNATLIALVNGLDPSATFWLALGPDATAAMKKQAGPKAPFPLPDTLTVAAQLEGGFETVARMADEPAATSAAQMLEGGIASMRMKISQDPKAGQNPSLQAFMDGIKVAAQGRDVRLNLPSGVAAAGIVAAIAIPSLLRARISANEAAAIGDIRTVISAEATYESANRGYGDLACLAAPAKCVPGYAGPDFLDEGLASAKEKTGYRRGFQPGPAGKQKGSYSGFAYTATPLTPGETGVRSFCGDATGRICYDPKGAEILPKAGVCPATCTDLR